jgi:Bacterial membrane protein YfhO
MATQTKVSSSAKLSTQKGKHPHIGAMQREQDVASRSLAHYIPEKWRDPVAILFIFLSLLIFFRGVLDSTHVFNAGDNVAFDALRPFITSAQAEGYSMPQWIPNIFTGMPAFSALVVTGSRTYDLVHEIFTIVQNIPAAISPNEDAMVHIWHYFIFGLGMYLLMRVTRNTSRIVALFAAFSAIFSTWIITYIMIGHNTKIYAVMAMPYIFMAIERLRAQRMEWQSLVFWCAVLATSIHILLESIHMQMIFYIACAVLIYFLTSLVVEYTRKSEQSRAHHIGPLVRSGILTLLMAGIAFCMSADRYLSSLAYEPYSIRGNAPIQDVQNTAAQNKKSVNEATTESGGLDWGYATAWSFSPQEIITFIIPGYYGFGKMPYTGGELNIPEGERIPTYWGQMNGTDAANYTGIVVFVLAIVGIFTLWKRDRLVPPLTIITIFAILLSFGGNWPILFRPMFNYFPLLNKFRAPMMALVLMQLAFPILAALTLEEILRAWKMKSDAEDSRLQKYFKYALYASGAFLAISVVFRGVITSSVTSGIQAAIQKGKLPQGYDALKDFISSTAANDALIGGLLATAACLLVYFFLKRKLSPLIMAVGILALTVVDQWRIDSRPMQIETKDDYASNFQTHDYLQFIQQDKSLYRVTDLTEGQPSNALVSYGIQTAGGYHAAKMREFQDVVDETGNEQGNGIFNPFMFNLLNTKYIVANGGLSQDQSRFIPRFQSKEPPPPGENGKPGIADIVWENPQALPRAFFAYRYEMKPKLDILHAMHDGTFNPRDVMYFDETPKDMPALATTPIDTAAETVTMDYKDQDITMHTKTSGNRLIFMSDAWYPDWTATVDGKPTPIYRADYAFRAIVAPAGTHEIKLTYYDSHYVMGRTISLTTNALALIAFGIGITGFTYSKRRKRPEVEIVPPTA